MSARQALILLMTKNHMLCPTAPTARPRQPRGENAPPGIGWLRVMWALRQPIPAPFSSCLSLVSHPDCRAAPPSLLICGQPVVRDRGTVRTSATKVISTLV